MAAGSPLCWPSSPEHSRARSAASRPSWWRWPALRVSASIAACDGVPARQGVSSAGLAMPGAASLANTASTVARASGVR